MTNHAPTPNDQELARRFVIGHGDLVIDWSLGFGHWGLGRVRYVVVALVLSTAAAACADKKQPTSRPTSARERQEQALRDPYSVGRDDEERYDISGGETREFDRKAFKRDWDSFWNP
jgi:hypothetical protein